MDSFDVAIIGGGIMGASAACRIAASGSSVALFDLETLPNPQGSSVDHSKIFRFAYPDPLYVQLAVESLALWRELEESSGTNLTSPAGLLLLAKESGSFEEASYDALHSLGLEAEILDRVQLRARFPQFDPAAVDFGVYDPSGAILHAEGCVCATVELARTRGVKMFERTRITAIEDGPASRITIACDGSQRFECAKLMVAAGAWTRSLVPELAMHLIPTRQEVVYFEPLAKSARSFDRGCFPLFIELSSGFYGFPIHRGGAMKIANHHKGVEVDPFSPRAEVGEEFIAACREFFAEFIPELADARVVETRVCLYNNTPDDDFIIDWHPYRDGILIVSGFSGHGFKFGPLIGRVAADLLLSGRTSNNIEPFRLSRLNG